jgi:hypothetical protein
MPIVQCPHGRHEANTLSRLAPRAVCVLRSMTVRATSNPDTSSLYRTRREPGHIVFDKERIYYRDRDRPQ